MVSVTGWPNEWSRINFLEHGIWHLGAASSLSPLHLAAMGWRALGALLVWRFCHFRITTSHMKILTVRLPDALVAEIEAEARRRMISKSDVVRERLTRPVGKRGTAALDAIADLVGSIEGLPADLSESKKAP